MNIKIDFESNIPAYLQLYEQFRNEITEGAYSYGSRFLGGFGNCKVL